MAGRCAPLPCRQTAVQSSPAALIRPQSSGRLRRIPLNACCNFVGDIAVNAVAFLKDGRFVTTGTDAKIAIWRTNNAEPEQILDGHTAPIVALAVSPDGALLASASWDHSVRIWPLAGGAPRIFEGHSQNVNGVAHSRRTAALW